MAQLRQEKSRPQKPNSLHNLKNKLQLGHLT